LKKKNQNQAKAHQKKLTQFRFISVSKGVNNILGVVGRRCGEDVVATHAENAENHPSLEGCD